jgi:hypothetical protein
MPSWNLIMMCLFIYVSIYICMYVCMYVYMYVCMYMSIYLSICCHYLPVTTLSVIDTSLI